jgi:hypothetical protein
MIMPGQNRHSLERENLSEIWGKYKITAIKVFLALVAVVSFIAEFVPLVGNFLAEQRYLGAGLFSAIILILIDTMMSSAARPSAAAEQAEVLDHRTHLQEHIDKAFRSGKVELDIAAYSSETFYELLYGFLNNVLEEETKLERLRLRLLLPDYSRPMGLPGKVKATDEDHVREHPVYKGYLQKRNRNRIGYFVDYFRQFADGGIVKDVKFEVRVHPVPPLFKFIIINNDIVFEAKYPISETLYEYEEDDGEHRVLLWEFKGERATMIPTKREGSAADRIRFHETRKWFNTMWDDVADKSVEVGHKAS